MSFFKKLINAVEGAVPGAVAGSVFGPIGTVAGGLFGGISGYGQDTTNWDKKNFSESVRQFNVMDDYNKNMTQYRVTDALKAGIHPLAALGQSASYSPTMSSSGSGSGNDYMERQMSRIQEIMSGQDLESRDLDLESKRLQNLLLKQQIANMQQPATPNNVSDPITLGDIARNPDIYSLKDIGKPQKYPELLKKWRLPDGSIVRLIDSDAIADTDWSNIEGDRAIAFAAPFYAGTYKSAKQRQKESSAREYYSWYNVTNRYFGGR